MYVPPTSNLDRAFTLLNDLADEISALNLEWINGGDLNIDDSNATLSKCRKLTGSFLIRHSLVQLIKAKTRVYRSIAMIIYHIYVNTDQYECP